MQSILQTALDMFSHRLTGSCGLVFNQHVNKNLVSSRRPIRRSGPRNTEPCRSQNVILLDSFGESRTAGTLCNAAMQLLVQAEVKKPITIRSDRECVHSRSKLLQFRSLLLGGRFREEAS